MRKGLIPARAAAAALSVATPAPVRAADKTAEAIALLLGLGIGMLATVFTASTLAILLEERWPYTPDKEKPEADRYATIDDGRGTATGPGGGSGAVV